MQMLVKLDTARRLLAEARSVDEIKEIRDQAEAMRLYARERDMGIEAVNHAAEIKVRAERRLGELLAEMPKNQGGRPSENLSHDATGFDPPTYTDLGIDRREAHRWQTVASIPEEVFEEHIAERKAAGEPLTTASVMRLAHVAHNSGQNEWYTPAEIIEAARAVLGQIDLDPASHPDAQAVVQAERFYTREDDGLSQDWRGRVWMNPPYSQPLVTHFCTKLVESFFRGDVTAAISLTNNGTETTWGQRLLKASTAVCFPDGRVKFWAPDRSTSTPLQGQMLCYLGVEPQRFRTHFAPFGAVLVAQPC